MLSETHLAELRLTRTKSPPKDSSATILDKIKALRNPRSHQENRIAADFVDETLEVAEELYAQCLGAHPGFGKFQEVVGGRLLFEVNAACIDCGPLLLPGSLAGEPASVLLYHGFASDRLGYRSLSGKEYSSQMAYQEVAGLLGKKYSPLEIVDTTSVSPAILHERMLANTRQTLSRLTELRRYRPESTINRAEVNAVLQAFIDGDEKLLIVDGPAGAGKTTWMCQLADERLTAGNTVLLESVDCLTHMSFPETLGHALKLKGGIATAFNRMGATSKDGYVLIVLDDLGINGREEEALLSLFQWIERLPQGSPIRIVATIRSDRLRSFLNRHEQAFPASCLRQKEMPPLNSHELLALATSLPISSDQDRELVISSRRDVARRMGEIADGSVRRPGLAVAILELSSLGSVPAGFSAALIYEELFRCEVLGMTGVGTASKALNPLRGRMLRKVAEVLMKRGSLQVAIDDDDLIPARLILESTGERAPDYEALLAACILVETMTDDYDTYVSFVDPRFFEFIAAINHSTGDLGKSTIQLYAQAQTFPSALAVAAHLLIRSIRASGVTSDTTPVAAKVWAEIENINHEFESLLLEVAALDGFSFLALFNGLCKTRSDQAKSLLCLLLRTEDSSLAERAARILIASADDDDELMVEARHLRIRALYLLDDYDAADEELGRMSQDKPPRVYLVDGEIALSRGDFERARCAYDRVLQACLDCSPTERANALSGMGYVLGQMGHLEEAEQSLVKAVQILEVEDDEPILAEAVGDLAEIRGLMGRPAEARKGLEQSLAINKRMGYLTGIGIVEGLLGEIDMAEGKLDDAETRFNKALDIARRVYNRWREAWIFERQATLCHLRGQGTQAEELIEQSRGLFEEIGTVRR